MVEFRPARPREASLAAEFILATGPEFFPALYGPRVKEYLAIWFQQPRNLFSYEHAWWLLVPDRPGGFLLGYSDRERRREMLNTGRLTFSAMGKLFGKRLPALLAAGRATGFAAPGTYYISQLAVAPEYRRRGYGAELIRWAASLAQRRGLRRLELDVERDNHPARRLYQRMGFRKLSEGTVTLDGKDFTFLRLRLEL